LLFFHLFELIVGHTPHLAALRAAAMLQFFPGYDEVTVRAANLFLGGL